MNSVLSLTAEKRRVLIDILAHQPRHREIQAIRDNLSVHKTQRIDAFLTDHSSVHLHYTPTYSSCLNQVELCFGKIERDVIARGIFTSVADLKRKRMRYIRQYNHGPKPVKWVYRNLTRRITTDLGVTVHESRAARQYCVASCGLETVNWPV